MAKSAKISVILPCHNEEKTIGICVKKALDALKGFDAEIIVSDSSTDRSVEVIKKLPVKIIRHQKLGYGNAIMEGAKYATGDILVIADADDTYDLREIPLFVAEIKKGHDLVLGSRLKGEIKKGAMPWLHQHIGNPVLSFLLSLFFRKKISDAHTGYRAIRRKAFEELQLKTKGMEFASEMIIKAIKNGLKMKEIPIIYSKRKGTSKLKSFNDGWKHLRFMLLYSPDYLFLLPGIFFFLLGLLILVPFTYGQQEIFGIRFDIHPLFVGSLLTVMGYMALLFWLFAKTYLYTHLDEKTPFMTSFFRVFTLEKAIIIGSSILLVGLIFNLWIFFSWIITQGGALSTIRLAVFATTMMILGLQTFFAGFFLSVLGIER